MFSASRASAKHAFHSEVASSPSISVTAANSTVQFAGNYTLAMVDADAVGTDDSTVTRHWLVNGVTISGK